MIRKIHIVSVFAVLLFASLACVAGNTVFEFEVAKPVDEVYPAVYKSLEQAHFYVVFEPDIGGNLSGFAKRWGDDYNRNKLSAIRSMVFCHARYANQISNSDPSMLGLCPLHVALVEKDGSTTVLFNRPTVIAANSPAYEIIKELEQEVIEAIKKGMN